MARAETLPQVQSNYFAQTNYKIAQIGGNYNMEMYTDYCTCFYLDDLKEVWIWDEIEDNSINRIPAENEEEANKIMNDWIEKAPDGMICQIL